MKIFKVLFTFLSFFAALNFGGKLNAQQQTHPIEIAERQQENDQKNLIVFIHTDWCQYCKSMQNSTFTGKKVKSTLDQNYYFTQLNAEEKTDINFGGKTFKYKPTGVKTGFHELATVLGTVDGEVSYPTLVILNPQKEIIFQYSGYLNAKDFFKILEKLNNQKGYNESKS